MNWLALCLLAPIICGNRQSKVDLFRIMSFAAVIIFGIYRLRFHANKCGLHGNWLIRTVGIHCIDIEKMGSLSIRFRDWISQEIRSDFIFDSKESHLCTASMYRKIESLMHKFILWYNHILLCHLCVCLYLV